VICEGEVVLGDGVSIGPNVLLRDVRIEAGSVILANCVIEEAHIGRQCRIGPFARIRPGTVCEQEARIGNFVEVKQSHIGAGSKVNHLSYVGDTQMGRAITTAPASTAP